MDLYGKPCKRDWMAKVVFLIQMLLTFGGRCNRYFWDMRLKILGLPNFNMLFQLVLTKLFKSELFLCLRKVGHMIKSCKEPIPIVPIPPQAFGKAANAPQWGRAVRTTTPLWGLKQCANASPWSRQHQNFIFQYIKAAYVIFMVRTGQLPIFVLKSSENSICLEVYQFPVPVT